MREDEWVRRGGGGGLLFPPFLDSGASSSIPCLPAIPNPLPPSELKDGQKPKRKMTNDRKFMSL
jgi:hypothetical protein